MCGIAGIINLEDDKVSDKILKKMTNALSHRGPDGEGMWSNDSVGFGHRRLKIIDLSNYASQPMRSMNERYVITFNGEIYNYLELRKELLSLGYNFTSGSDTEVLLKALIHWGTDLIPRLNGMFAFAFIDRKSQQIILARDRYGVKPLYYSNNEKYFLFGSEQKSILAHPSIRAELNEDGLIEYFTFQNLFSNKTLMKGINLLEPGHYIEIKKNKKKNKIKKIKYWDYQFSDSDSDSDSDEIQYIDELNRLFEQAVYRQTIGDVEIGTYLSGGMDSGSIAAVAANKFPNIKSFTCGFDLSSASGIELTYDERETAEMLSSIFGTEHYEIILKSGDMEKSLKDLTWHLEEPRVGQSYPNLYAAKLASKFVKVVLSGAGGDELFGGYPWRYYRTAHAQNFEDYLEQYYLYWQRLLTDDQLSKIFRPIGNSLRNISTRDIFRNVFVSHDSGVESPEDYVNQSLYFESKTFLHGLLVVEDKLSMRYGLENRVPFMDNDLVEFAMKCPVKYKLKNLDKVRPVDENIITGKNNKFFQKTNDGKQILRKMMNKYIPYEITNAKKQGFSSPDASWFKGESIDFVKNKLKDKNAHIYDYMDYVEVNKLLEDHFRGKDNKRLLIWSLLNVNEYLVQNF